MTSGQTIERKRSPRRGSDAHQPRRVDHVVRAAVDGAGLVDVAELEDKVATFLALFVIFVVPVVLIALFWMVHILPEKIAHKRHHPQFEAIRTLCLLSLVFGGLLWPFAWIWAYSKPVMYKMAYGTDKAPDALRSTRTFRRCRSDSGRRCPERSAGAAGTARPSGC